MSSSLAAGSECFAVISGDTLLVFRKSGQQLPVSGLKWISKEKTGSPNFLASQNTDPRNRKQALKGLLSPDGEWLIPPVLTGSLQGHKHFVVAEAVAEPCCTIGRVNIGGNQPSKYLIFDWNGEPLITSPAKMAIVGPDGHSTMFEHENLYGLVISTDVKLPAEYNEIWQKENGWIYVRKGNRFGALKWVK